MSHMESVVNDRVTRVDWIVAAGVGVFAALVLGVCSHSGLDPALWEDAACARGLVAPVTVFGSVCRLLPGAMTQVGGWLFGGVLAFVLAMSVRTSFVLLVRPAVSSPRWHMIYSGVFSGCAAIMAVCSHPVWNICQALTPALIQVLGLCTAILLFLRWLTVGRQWRLLLLMAVLGLCAADGPYAFVLLAAGVLAFGLVWKDALNGAVKLKTRLPDYDELPVWRMMVSFLVPLAIGALLNMKAFSCDGGLVAAGWSRKNLLFHYAMSYGSALLGHNTRVSFAIFLILGAIPFLVNLRVMVRQGYEESKMTFSRGCIVVLTGLVVLLQILPYPSLWFWRWSVQASSSPVGMSLTCCFAAAAAFYSMACFVADNRESLDHGGKMAKGWVPALMVGLALLGVSGTCQPVVSKVQDLVNEAIAETVDGMKDGEWIFTDGVLDLGLELEANRRDRTVRPVNLLAGVSSREIYLRNRGLTNVTDRTVMQRGPFELLSHWSRQPERANDLKLQLGLDQLNLASNAVPVHGAMASCLNPADRAMAERNVSAGRSMAERAFEIASSDALDSASVSLMRTFNEVMWRLSSQARLRGENELADRLDALHGIDRNQRLEQEAKRLRPL